MNVLGQEQHFTYTSNTNLEHTKIDMAINIF